MTRADRSPIMVRMTTTTTIEPQGLDRRSAASIIERETEKRVARREKRTPLLALVGAAVTAVIALAAAGALLA
jgi:hypothetical protein